MSYFPHETNISNLCKYESVQSLDSLNRGKFGNLASRCEARPELQADSPDLTQYKSVFLFLNKNNKFIYIIIYGQRIFFLFSTGLHRPGRSTTFHRALGQSIKIHHPSMFQISSHQVNNKMGINIGQ